MLSRWDPHIFFSKLINRKMDGAKRASTNFLLDCVLIYAVYCSAIVFAVAVFRMGIERFLKGACITLVYGAERVVIGLDKHPP